MKKAILFCLMFTNSLVIASPLQLEEVVVTAQRKAELLQEVPLSLSVLSEEDLDSRQIETVKQLLTNSPNVIGNNNLATASALSVFIRGVGTTENLATAETSVGVYVDGVYVARQGFNNFALHDVESVEVLRGPQGVLYGRNTNGGAIKINLNKPTFHNLMTNNVSYGAVDYIYGDSVINTSINENLAVRFNLSAYQHDGFVTAPYLNRDVNDGDGRSGRLAVRYKDDNIDVNLSADYSKVSTNGNFQVDIGGILTPRPSDLFTTLSTFNAMNNNETRGAVLNVTYNSDYFELQSITGYRKLNQFINSDASGQPVSLFTFYQDQQSEQVSQEVQVVGNVFNNLSYVGGVYFFKENADVYLNDILRTAPTANALIASKIFSVDIENYAAYGQLEYVLNKVTFAAGLRYTSEDRDLSIIQTSNNPSSLFNFNTNALNARGVATRKTYSDTTPRLSVSYKVNDNAFLYGSYTEGFRAGGWTGRAVRVDQFVNFNPEKVQTIESGLKLNGANWRFNSAVFNTKYTDLFNTLPINGVFTVQTANAKIEGLETEGSWLVTDWLNVYGSVGLLDTKYTGNRPANLATELQRAPEVQVKVGAKVMWKNLVLNVGAYDASEYRLTPANLAVTAPALAGRGIELTKVPVVVDTSLTWSPNRQLSLTLACTNCFDREFVEGAVYVGQWAGAWAGDSQMWSVTLTQQL